MVAEGRVDGYKDVERAGRVAREQTGGAKKMGVEIRVVGKQELRAEEENERFLYMREERREEFRRKRGI